MNFRLQTWIQSPVNAGVAQARQVQVWYSIFLDFAPKILQMI